MPTEFSIYDIAQRQGLAGVAGLEMEVFRMARRFNRFDSIYKYSVTVSKPLKRYIF